MTNYAKLQPGYARLWKEMSVKQAKLSAVDAAAKQIIENKARYEAVAAKSKVPWYLIGLLHKMESGCNFDTHLHNGDSLNGRTRRVPAGRPAKGEPPFTWEESALDALAIKDLHKVKEWTLERCLFEAERYNGWGYLARNKPNSPYIWSFTNHYTKGKYIRDGVYSPTAVSAQIGVAPVLKRLMELDRSVAPHLEEHKKSAVETVAGSKSLTLLAVVGTTLWSWVTGLFDYGVDTVSAAFGVLPLAVGAAQESVSSGQAVAEWFKFDSAKIMVTLAAVTMVVVFYREFKRKRTQV